MNSGATELLGSKDAVLEKINEMQLRVLHAINEGNEAESFKQMDLLIFRELHLEFPESQRVAHIYKRLEAEDAKEVNDGFNTPDVVLLKLEKGGGPKEIKKAIEDVQLAPSVKFWMEPEFAAETRRYPQTGEPNSFVQQHQYGTFIGGKKWTSEDIIAYDSKGALVGSISVATSGKDEGAFKIVVRENAQRKGWGKKLLSNVNSNGVQVWSTNNGYATEDQMVPAVVSAKKESIGQGYNAFKGIVPGGTMKYEVVFSDGDKYTSYRDNRMEAIDEAINHRLKMGSYPKTKTPHAKFEDKLKTLLFILEGPLMQRSGLFHFRSGGIIKKAWDDIPDSDKNDIVDNIFNNSDYLKNNYNPNTLKENLDNEIGFAIPLIQLDVKKAKEEVDKRWGVSDAALRIIRQYKTLNPVIAAQGKFFDGGHRITVASERGMNKIPAYDIESLLNYDWSKFDDNLPFPEVNIDKAVRAKYLKTGGLLERRRALLEEPQSEYTINDQGGYDYNTERAKKIAERAQIITLPADVVATNCSNCVFQGNGFCDNKYVLLPVTKRMCCAFWDGRSIGSYFRNLPAATFFPGKRRVTEQPNKEGGLNYVGEELKRAAKADLITLPPHIPGTNCGNCKFVQGKFCNHPKIQLPVNNRMSCSWWDNVHVRRLWGKAIEIKFEVGGRAGQLLAPNGKPSNLTQEQWHLVRTPAFIAWFGNWLKHPEKASKVVDSNGEPLVCWHGTCKNFTVFRRRLSDIGIHFGTEGQAKDRINYVRRFSLDHPEKIEGSPIFLKLFLNIKTPLRLMDAGAWDGANVENELIEVFKKKELTSAYNDNKSAHVKNLQKLIRQRGFDGIVYRNDAEIKGADEMRKEVDRLRQLFYTKYRILRGIEIEQFTDKEEYKKWKKADVALSKYEEKHKEDSYIIFESSQAKLADGSNTTFNSSDSDIRFGDGGNLDVCELTFSDNPLRILKSLPAPIPGGSSIQFREKDEKGTLYMVGDNSTYLLSVDTTPDIDWSFAHRTKLFNYDFEGVIPKGEKPDLEASFLDETGLVLIGSGSKEKRKVIVQVPFDTMKPTVIDVSTFINRVQALVSVEINIEGAEKVGDKVVLVSRGVKGNPGYMIVTSYGFWLNQVTAPIAVYPLDLGNGSSISGIEYVNIRDRDMLVFLSTTEDTPNAYDDGPIGDSYVGIIPEFSKWLLNPGPINVSSKSMLNLSQSSVDFKGQKTEGICVEWIRPDLYGDVMTCWVIADNDNEESRLFKIQLTIKTDETEPRGFKLGGPLYELGKAIKKRIRTNEAFAILDADKELKGSDWGQGACYPLARAIYSIYGGKLKAIKDKKKGNRVQHVMVKIGDGYFDDQGYQSAEAKLKEYTRSETRPNNIPEPWIDDFRDWELGDNGRGEPGFVDKVKELLSKREPGQLNDYHKFRSAVASQAVEEMSKHPYSVAEKQEQARRLKAQKLGDGGDGGQPKDELKELAGTFFLKLREGDSFTMGRDKFLHTYSVVRGWEKSKVQDSPKSIEYNLRVNVDGTVKKIYFQYGTLFGTKGNDRKKGDWVNQLWRDIEGELMVDLVNRNNQFHEKSKIWEMTHREFPEIFDSYGRKFELGGLYHGSPYEFETFSAEKIGTGEGAAAFGWGLYFTDAPGIAGAYARHQAIEHSRVHDISWYLYGNGYTEEQELEIIKMPLEERLEKINARYKERMAEIEAVRKKRPENEGWIAELTDYANRAFKRADDAAKGMSVYPITYNITLFKGNPTLGNWLIWDRPCSKEQNLKIQEQLEKEGKTDTFTKFMNNELRFPYMDGVAYPDPKTEPKEFAAFVRTGKHYYFLLQKFLGGPKAASQFLLRAGIDGIKYPAESFGKGTTSDTATKFNYVVFDTNAINIDKAEKL